MRFLKIAFVPAVFLATFLFTTNAFADIDIRAGIDFSIAGISEDSAMIENGRVYRQHLEFEDPMIGVSGTLSLGYRWTIFGLYVDQVIGGLWWTGPTSELEGYRYDDASFLGGTFLTAKFIAPLGSTEVDLGFGLGAMYSAGPNWGDIDYNKGYTIIIDKDMDPSAAFAVRFVFGFTHFFGKLIGIGLHLDYNVAFNFVKPNKAIWGNVSNFESTVHQFNPGLHVQIKI
ncbi:MAG: hypothetical protein J6A01_00245 [Proteobacteria bacterium]|nr:hypothetical protein [Pseudomonadota bacterium]